MRGDWTRSVLSFSDISINEFSPLLDRAEELKKKISAGKELHLLDNRLIGILFEKPSTRTRTSFEAAAMRLGGRSLYLASSELQLSRGEPIKDTARALGKYLDAMVARVYSNDTVVQLSEYSGIPVINGLSNLEHPTQLVSDMLTIRELKGRIAGIDIAFIGAGNNVSNALVLASATGGANVTVACPHGYEPNASILAKARKLARSTHSRIRIVNDPREAAAGADVLYTDVWVSMGEESETKKRMAAFRGYQINGPLLAMAKDDAIVMHCLPAHRGLEITDDVIEGRQSAVWRQSENKLYGAAAVLDLAINGSKK
jgi:ornithine carbamoyltransferase